MCQLAQRGTREGEEGLLLMASEANLPVVIIGAGPVGLAAAAHMLGRGIEPLILEASTDVAASLRDWAHVRLFSPWRYNVDKAATAMLEASGWLAPPLDELPTGGEIVERYLRPFAALPQIQSRLWLDHKVTGISRMAADKVKTSGRGDSPFVVRTVDAAGNMTERLARAVLDASGTWWSHNPLGASGLPAQGESEASDRIHYGIPDINGEHRDRYAGRATQVVGAGHSAANSILALAELARAAPGTKIIWATRGTNLTRVFGGGSGDALPARGKLGTALRAMLAADRLTLLSGFRIDEVRPGVHGLDVYGTRGGEPLVQSGIDAIIAATGQRPALDLLREVRLSLDPALECVHALGPLIDPNEHSCGTVRPHGQRELAHPDPDFYIVGSKSYGRAPTFLLATGYEQVRSVVAMLAGDEEAALRVELDLPETGVCNSALAPPESDGQCCAAKSACC
ncbi:MAG: hypothetical protein JKY37_10015 [Nannocystaceae bacterium]|nr:hypothetical protein [Nannocystaceae bacterium]